MATTLLSNGLQYPDGTIQYQACKIKSVQNLFVNPKGSVSGGDFAYASNITIAAVNTSKSFILYPNGPETTTTYIFRTMTAKFLNSTTVQLCCDNAASVSFYNVRIQVVEFQ
jgi:hypothetical protein